MISNYQSPINNCNRTGILVVDPTTTTVISNNTFSNLYSKSSAGVMYFYINYYANPGISILGNKLLGNSAVKVGGSIIIDSTTE